MSYIVQTEDWEFSREYHAEMPPRVGEKVWFSRDFFRQLSPSMVEDYPDPGGEFWRVADVYWSMAGPSPRAFVTIVPITKEEFNPRL